MSVSFMSDSSNSYPPTSKSADGPRLAAFLVGDLKNDPGASTKYGHLFRSLERLYGPVPVYDVALRGVARTWNRLRTFHPVRRTWKERSYKNPFAFAMRSRMAGRIISSLQGRVDAVIQVGVLFNAGMQNTRLPLFIYTDYTARLSAENRYRFLAPWKGSMLLRWLNYEGETYHRAAHIFTRSKLVQKDIVDRYGIPAKRVSVVGGGVNFDPFPQTLSRAPTEGAVVLFIGSNFLRKGGDILLEAFAIVRRRFPNCRLKLLTRDKIPSRYPMEGVEILPYVWDREWIARLYCEADFLVLPSRQETWGDVILEAAAYSLPSIGTYGQAMEELIQDGKTGLLVPMDDIGQLASALERLLGDPNLRVKMGWKARERADSLYTWDRVVERMTPTIDSIIGCHREA
jgi:glycosyltransferase involved in cell wall biosynthesis